MSIWICCFCGWAKYSSTYIIFTKAQRRKIFLTYYSTVENHTIVYSGICNVMLNLNLTSSDAFGNYVPRIIMVRQWRYWMMMIMMHWYDIYLASFFSISDYRLVKVYGYICPVCEGLPVYGKENLWRNVTWNKLGIF